MQVANIIVWDLETGGLNKETHAVAEIAMIALDSETLEEVDRYEAIIAPYKIRNAELVKYDQKALDYNGLTMRKIQSGKDAKLVAKEIEAFCKKQNKGLRGGNGKPISAGHNIQKFDIPFLEFFLANFSVKYQDLFQEWCLDTLWMTRLRWPKDGQIVNHQLGTACQSAGIELYDAHRAMNDVEGNAKLVKWFLSCMRQQSTVASTIIDNEEKTRATFRF